MGKLNRRWQGIALGLTVVMATMAVAVWLGRSGSSTEPSRQARSVAPRSVDPRASGFVGGAAPGFGQKGSPFAYGQSMSLSEAQNKVGFNIPRPNDKLASDGQITIVWVAVNSGVTQIELQYTSGLTVDLETAGKNMTSDADQLSFFQEQVAEDAAQTNGAAVVTSVNGQPALLVPQNSAVWANGKSQGAPGGVEFNLEGEAIDVYGYFATDDLQRVASTVSARPG